MKTLLILQLTAILFLLTIASAENSNDESETTKARVKRERSVIHINRSLRPKKSYGSSRPRYVSHPSYETYDAPIHVKSGPPKHKYGSSKIRPSKPVYGPTKHNKYGPSKRPSHKPPRRPHKHSSSYFVPQSEEEDYGFGEPPLSFGEPPVGYSNSESGFEPSFDDFPSEYEGQSYSTQHKKIKKPKKPQSYFSDFKVGYDDEDVFESYPHEDDFHKFETKKRPITKIPSRYKNTESVSTQSITTYHTKPNNYKSPFDNPENYGAQGIGYPDEELPVSDYFGAPLTAAGSSTKYETYSDEFDNEEYNKSPGHTYKSKPIQAITISERPKKKKVVKVVKVRTVRKKPRVRQTEGQVVVGAHYSEPPSNIRHSDYSDGYDSSYAGSEASYAAVAPGYSTFNSGSIKFSPQNVNEAFTADKRLEAGYHIDMSDHHGAPTHMGTIIAQAPNYPYNYKDNNPSTDVKITKSISHDYYAGSAPNPYYPVTNSPPSDATYYRSHENVLPPNYFDFTDTSLAEKSSQYRDLSSISLRNENITPNIISSYDENLKNHRT